jgi:prophage antirepressor-like protein
MEQLTIVEYKGYKIRVYGMKHNPWFSGEDIAQILGYVVCADALRKVDAEDKVDMLVSEFGLFTLISLGSNIEFKRFVTREMLPQLHKKGQCIQTKLSEKRKNHERLYELANGEKLNRTNLSYRAISLGMSKSETRRNSIIRLVEFINEKENQIANKDLFEKQKVDYPHTYDYVDELCFGNLTTLWRLLPENSYIQYSGEYHFNEQAVQAIKSEIATWK